jgi:hypothetical protein
VYPWRLYQDVAAFAVAAGIGAAGVAPVRCRSADGSAGVADFRAATVAASTAAASTASANVNSIWAGCSGFKICARGGGGR